VSNYEFSTSTVCEQSRTKDVKNELVSRFSSLEHRLGVLNCIVETVVQKQQQLESKVNRMGSIVDDKLLKASTDVDKQIKIIRDELHEEQRKIARMSNIVLFGVPEKKEGLDLASNLLKLLIPDWKGHLDDDRIGAPPAPKPRPLRVRLENYAQKRKALSCKRKLASRPEFRGISVQADLTKSQQSKKKERRVQPTITESSKNYGSSSSRVGVKRKNVDQDEEDEQNKLGKDNSTFSAEDEMLDWLQADVTHDNPQDNHTKVKNITKLRIGHLSVNAIRNKIPLVHAYR
jgi:hypothetical protein